MNYALARQDRVYTETEDDVNMDDEFFPVLEEREEPTEDISVNAQFINHSGGALGSDTMWGKIGEEYGVYSKHYYAEGQKTPNGNTALGKQLLSESDVHLKEANKKLGRLFPTSKDYVNNLLRRNWFQVKNADAVFAIGTIADNGTVNGGTGWAVQMAIDNNKDVYVFDQSRLKWYRNRDHKWSEVTTPKLTPNFAGIGTREITQEGIQAIRNVYALTSKGR